MKIVINKCHGGFSLSDDGMRLYAQKKGVPLYVEPDEKYKSLGMATYWTVPPEERPALLKADWHELSTEQRQEQNKLWGELILSNRDMPRNDPFLVQVVEELGNVANGTCASLGVVEIPEDVEWEIQEYAGSEWVAETHRKWS